MALCNFTKLSSSNAPIRFKEILTQTQPKPVRRNRVNHLNGAGPIHRSCPPHRIHCHHLGTIYLSDHQATYQSFSSRRATIERHTFSSLCPFVLLSFSFWAGGRLPTRRYAPTYIMRRPLHRPTDHAQPARRSFIVRGEYVPCLRMSERVTRMAGPTLRIPLHRTHFDYCATSESNTNTYVQRL